MYALYDSQGICRGKFNTREAALRSVPKDQQRYYKALPLPQGSDAIVTALDCDGSDDVIGQLADFDVAKDYLTSIGCALLSTCAKSPSRSRQMSHKHTAAFKDFVRHPFAWPGGYPLYAVMDDGGAICRNCAKSEAKQIISSTREHARDGWDCAGIGVNWEDASLYCDHCGERIESAYAEDDAI